MVKQYSNNELIVLVLLLIEWIVLWYFGATYLTGQILSISLIAFNLYQIIKCYKNNLLGLAILNFYLLSYNAEPSIYFIFHEQIAYRSQAENISTVYDVGLYTYLFYIIVSVYSTKYKLKKTVHYSFVGSRNSPIIFWCCYLLSLICILKGKSGETIFQSGGYGASMESLEVSSLFGYGIITIVLCMIYANSKFKFKCILLLSVFYVIRDLSFGGRIDSIQLILVWFVVYFQFKLKKKSILSLAIIGFMFNSIWEIYRSATSGDLVVLLAEGSSGLSITTGNSADVFYASMRLFYMVQEGVLTVSDRILSGLYFLLSIFIPYDKLPPISNLSQYMASIYTTGGGGLCPIFIYMMFGLLGLILCAFFIAKQLSILNSIHPNKYRYFYAVLLYANTPRWWAYYPIGIIKFCLVGLLMLCIVITIEKYLKQGHLIEIKSEKDNN